MADAMRQAVVEMLKGIERYVYDLQNVSLTRSLLSFSGLEFSIRYFYNI